MADHSIATCSQTSAFKDLLNPVRDLTASWGVDIAEQLTNYAAFIGLQVPKDGDDDMSADDENPSVQTTLETLVDFAQAALVLQGTTSIYSQKVEHLYVLVFAAVSALNQIDGTKKDRVNGGVAEGAIGGGNNDDSECDDAFNIDNIDFLTLDDEIEEADASAIKLPSELLPPPGSLSDTTCLRPIPPMLRQNTSPLEAGNLEHANYKMRTAILHPSGALLTEGCPPVDENLDLAPKRLSPSAPIFSKTDTTTLELDDMTGQSLLPSTVDNDDEPYFGPPPDDDNFGDNDLPPFASQTGESCDPQRNVGARPNRKDRQPSQKRDPFTMLNPHEERPSLNRPLRVKQKYRKGSTTRMQEVSLFVPTACDENSCTLIDSIMGRVPRNASLSSYVSTNAAWSPFRALVRRQRALRKASISILDSDELFEDDDNDSECDVQVTRSAGDGLHTADSHVAQVEDVLLFDDDEDEALRTDISRNPDTDEVLPSSFGMAVSEAFAGNDNNSIFSGITRNTEMMEGDSGPGGDYLASLASNYSQACQNYLAQTAWMWEKRVVDSQLAKRVEDWSERIHPLLEQEEQRKEFDIRECGETVVTRLREMDKENDRTKVPMSMVLRAPAKFEVCRLFLATLQLANQYSVNIIAHSSCQVSDPELQLVEEDGTKTFETPLARTKMKKRKHWCDSTPVGDSRQPRRSRLENT